MAMYLGNKKVAVTNTIEKQVPSMKAFFDAGGKCSYSTATSFDGCWQFGDTSNVTNMSQMFQYCSSLTTVPLFDTANVTNMNYMFYYCPKLITVPLFDTANVKYMASMFSNCSKITVVPQFDTSKVTNMNYMFSNCNNLEAIHMININANLNISASTKFTREALLEIIGNLKAQTSGTKTLTMGSTNLAKLTDEDKDIATSKGWTLA